MPKDIALFPPDTHLEVIFEEIMKLAQKDANSEKTEVKGTEKLANSIE